MEYNNFLTELCTLQHQTKYARITALDMNDMPLQDFVGHITDGGTVNLDGHSAIRRTCSISMVVDLEDKEKFSSYNWSYWGLTHKFRLEIGLLNTINNDYPEIIWFNQGVFVISSFSYSQDPADNMKISISGKDKMAKLNGELGGTFPAKITLDTIEEVAKDGSITYTKQHIYDIIRRVVHEIGGEPEHNIIVEDLPAYGYELWNYLGTNDTGGEMPMYLFRYADDNNHNLYNKVMNMTIDGEKLVYHLYNEATSEKWNVKYDFATNFINIYDASGAYSEKMTQAYSYKLKEIIESELYHRVNDTFEIGDKFTLTNNPDGVKYKIQKVKAGEIAGYHETALIYPYDLIMNAGDSITGALDKIKDLLGNFEYFYDTDGRFIFRKQKNYINELFSPINGDLIEPFVAISPYSYKFEDKKLLQSLSYTPAIDKVKNDFVLWGNKRGTNSEIPIHARYTISKKPDIYTTFPFYKKAYDRTYIIPHELYQQTDENGTLILSSEKPGANGYIKGWDQINSTPLPGTGYFVVYGDKTTRKKVNKPKNCCESEYVAILEGDKIIYRKANYYELQDELCLKYYIEVTPIKPSDDTTLYGYDEDNNEIFIADYTNDIYYKKENNVFVDVEFENNLPDNLDEVYVCKEESTTYYSEYYHNIPEGGKIRDWRELIYLMARDYYQHNQNSNYVLDLMKNNKWTQDKRATGYENFYADMQAFWRELYDPEGQSPKYIRPEEKEGKYKYWSRAVIYYPETLNFWIDFLDCGEGSEINKYSIQNIGFRTQVENSGNNGISAIFYKTIPDIQFVLPYETPVRDMSYTLIHIQDNMKQLFTISSKGVAANERAKDLIWINTCTAEGVSISCIPLYFLEPNTRIKLLGEDYLINSIQIPTSTEGTMQISASKIIKPI